MTGTELARRDTDSWVDVVGPVGTLAENVANTLFVPKGLRGSIHAVAACILTGREIGLGPMTSLQGIHVVDGHPTLSAELMRTLVFAAGHRIAFEETTNVRCIAVGYRHGVTEPAGRVEWTIEDAKRARLAGKDNWSNYPRQMLANRATSELCRLVFPDVIAGMGYTDEELEDTDGQPAETAPRRATVSRSRARKTAPAAPDAPAPAEPSTGSVAARALDGAPPLDDEAPPIGDDAEEGALLAERLNAEDDVVEGELVDDLGEATAPGPRNPDHAERVGGTATRAQLTKLHASLGDLGYEDRADKLRACSTLVGHPLTSSAELTKDEAHELIEITAHALASADPPARFEEILRISNGEQL